MIKVYIASAYMIGDVAVNVKRQIDVADILIENGFAPFAPLLSHFQHMVHPRPYSGWVKLDLEWVKACNCVLRLEGESKGADIETEFANSLNIPVFYNIESIIKHYFE